MSTDITRREFIAGGASIGAASLIGLRPPRVGVHSPAKFKLSVTRWPFRQFTLDQLCQMARELGIDSLERLEPNDWAIPKRYGVTLCMELLNSKIEHPDYQCDHTAWGVAMAKQINSPRFKLLYDIYHMQIMEGDVIRTVTDNIKYIAHFHTGGVPGRHEIDETQELNYHRVMQAIADAGFPGYVAQEFVPTRDPRESLAQAVRICTV